MVTAASRLSSSWAKALVVAVLLAAAVAVGIRSFGDDTESPDRLAVRQYIVEVNTTQQTFVLQLDQVSTAYRTLRLGSSAPAAQERKVERAEATLVRLRSRIAALPTPPAAARLRARLLALADLQVGLAREVTAMAHYVPVQAAEGKRLVASTRRLRAALDAAGSGAAQAEAFTTYGQEVAAAARRLGRADAPPVLEPGHREQVARLQRLASLARKIAAAFRAGTTAEVNRLFTQFARVTADTGTTPAARRAVIAFNAQLAAIGEQRAAVDAERRRLSVSLG